MIGTELKNLYGKDYKDHIRVGTEYWFFFPDSSDVFERTHENWHKVKITFIRSTAVFYTVVGLPELDESYFDISSFMAGNLQPVRLSIKREGFKDVTPEDFNQEITIVTE